MNHYTIPIVNPVCYHMCGKFESLSPDWKHANLNLDDYELFVVTNGVLYIEHNGSRYRIEQGEMLLLPPVPPPGNTRRGYQSSACTFYWLHFGLENCRSFDDYNMDALVIPAYSILKYPEKIIILMKQLQDSVRNNLPPRTLNYMASAILCRVYDDVTQSPVQDNVRRTGKQLYNDIEDYVKHNIHTPLTVNSIARKFGYNEKYLSQMFKSMSGETLKQHIINRKIEEANFLLTDTNLTIMEISSILGYSDNHNFMRSYKKVTGMSPTEYRNAFSKRVLNH